MPKRSTAAVALALSLGVFSADALAFGLGEPEITSTLGQPLRMRVPLQADPAVDLSPQCLRLLGNPRDPVPTLTQARLSIEQSGKQSWLRIDSVAQIDEPILRVTVDAGCAQHVQREFIVLLDPPAAPNSAVPVSPALASLSAAGNYNIAPPNATIASQIGATPELDLGVARIQGHLGQPLSLQIPVLGSAAATIDNDNVRTARLLGSDGAPLRNRTEIGLSRSDAGTFLQIITTDAVADPAVRVQVEVATASASVRREYGVLLDPANPAPKPAPEPLGAPLPADVAGETPAAAPAAPPAEAKGPDINATPAAAVPPPPKPHKRLHHVPKAPTTIPSAPANGSAAAPEAAHAPAADAKAAAPAAAGPAKSAGPDRLVLSAPDDQAEAAAKRFSEMDQRVKDLTQEIVRLRSDLATQKEHEAELVAQNQHSSGSWILATIGAVGVFLGLFVLWMRRRGSGSWNPASWEQVTNHYVEQGENVGGDTRMGSEGRPTRSAAPAAPAAEPRPAARPAAAPAARRPANTQSSEPSTILPMTAPIEVTEVLGNEPSIEQLYTLFYDIGGNTAPGGPLGKPPQPSSVLPAVDVPKHDSLDLDLGIPDSIQSARDARAQGAIKSNASKAGAPAAKPPSFTYEEPNGAVKPLALDVATNVGPVTEMPRDGEFAQTRPDLDLDLTTNIGGVTQTGPLTEIPRDDAAAGPGGAAPRKPLDLDLNTNIGAMTQVGPLTEIPRDDDPTTQVEVDLDLNTNVQALSAEENDLEREGGQAAMATIPLGRTPGR